MRAFLVALVLGGPLLAAAQSAPSTADEKQKVERAVERCKAQRGVDCDTPQGLQEWVLLERSRSEAVKDGSRRKGGGGPR